MVVRVGWLLGLDGCWGWMVVGVGWLLVVYIHTVHTVLLYDWIYE